MLRELANVIRGNVRCKKTLFARCGGEEFVVVAGGNHNRGAVQVAERLREAVETAPVPVRDDADQPRPSASASPTPAATRKSTPALLRKAADEKLYEAKRTGRNKVCS